MTTSLFDIYVLYSALRLLYLFFVASLIWQGLRIFLLKTNINYAIL